MDQDKLWKLFSLAALLALGSLAAAILNWGPSARQAAAPWRDGREDVVIDPGHGGEDGGAVAGDGTVESQINLAIAQRLDVILTFWGQETELLRREDVSLHDPEAGTIREKKVSDLHNRVARINALEDPRLISIHQNFFPSSKYRGAQVFYSGGPLAQPWAALTQENLKTCLDPSNNRVSAMADHSIYLMNHISCPALLVECGFLSNLEERERLKDPDYQTALAAVIAGSYLESKEIKEEQSDGGQQGEESVLLHPVR